MRSVLSRAGIAPAEYRMLVPGNGGEVFINVA